MARFLAIKPESTLAKQVELMEACVRKGPAAIDWRAIVASHPAPLLMASIQLSNGGNEWACALAGFEAIITLDTASTTEADSRRWPALIAWQGM